jgi:hypothetical protein
LDHDKVAGSMTQMNRQEAPTTQAPGTAAAVASQLRAALTRVGDALAGVDADALLAAEEALGQAVAAVAIAGDAADRPAAVEAVRRARAELMRCRRLGASFSGLARAMGRVGQVVDGYDRAGGYVASAGVRPSVLARV